MLSLRTAPCARPAARASSRARCVVVRAQQPTVDLGKQVAEAVKGAEEACANGTAQDCAVAWDTVEELSAAAAHKKVANAADPTLNDPLEAFCQDSPDADECRVYE